MKVGPFSQILNHTVPDPSKVAAVDGAFAIYLSVVSSCTCVILSLEEGYLHSNRAVVINRCIRSERERLTSLNNKSLCSCSQSSTFVTSNTRSERVPKVVGKGNHLKLIDVKSVIGEL